MKSNQNFLVAVTCSVPCVIYIVLKVHVTLFCAFCTQVFFFVEQPLSLADKMIKINWNDVLLSFCINFNFRVATAQGKQGIWF